MGDEGLEARRRWWRSRRGPRRRACARLPIISPSEEFLPPTWARSVRRRSCSHRMLALKAGTPVFECGDGAGQSPAEVLILAIAPGKRGVLASRRTRIPACMQHDPTTSRPVFYVSDGTGITAETIGHSLLTQFGDTRFITDRIPFVDNAEKAREAAERIRRGGEAARAAPDRGQFLRRHRAQCACWRKAAALMLDIFAPFIEPLERELGQASARSRVGQAHGMVDFETYHRRINAMNYALTHDDGISMDYGDADLILIGVSRAGKTPTCVYLALHYGVRAANYPLTEEDLDSDRLPAKLRPYRNKLFGLTIDPMRLQQIRQERRPNSRYAQLETCKREVAAAEALLRQRRHHDAEHHACVDRGNLQPGNGGHWASTARCSDAAQ